MAPLLSRKSQVHVRFLTTIIVCHILVNYCQYTFDNSGSQPICMIILFYRLALNTNIDFHPNVHIIHQSPQFLVQIETVIVIVMK